MSQSRTFKAGLLASGNLLTSLVGLVILAVLSRLFDKGDYATYRQTLLTFQFLAPLLLLGLPQALYYFMPREPERARGVLIENLVLLAGVGAAFCVFLLAGGGGLLARAFDNPELEETLPALAPYALFALPVGALTACLVARERVGQATTFNVASRVTVLLCVLIPSWLLLDPLASIAGTVIGQAVVLVPALYLMLRACRGTSGGFTLAGARAQLKFSVPLGAAGMVAAINLNLDKAVVASHSSPEVYAGYINGAVELPLFAIVTGASASILLPELAALLRDGREGDAHGVWGRATVKCALVIFPIAAFLLVMAPEFVRVVFGEKYPESVLPFRVYLLLLPVRAASFVAIFQASGRGSLLLWRALCAVVFNLALSLVMIRGLGPVGAALATVTVVYLWTLPYSLAHLARILQVPAWRVLPLRRLLLVALVSATLAPVHWLKPVLAPLGSLGSLALVGAIYFTLVLGLFHGLGLFDWRDLANEIRGRFARKEAA